MVFRYCYGTDLQNVRLTCQQFNKLATPIVFHELILRLDMTFEEYSQRPSFPFGRYVNVLRVLTAEYAPMWSRKHFSEVMGNRCNKCDNTYDVAAEQEIFQKYQELQQYHVKAIETGEMVSYLTVLLLAMPNLQKVYLTDGAHRSFSIDRLKNCACPLQHQKTYGFNLGSGLGNAYGKLHLGMLILGLSSGQNRLTELVVTSSFPKTGLGLVAFNTTPAQVRRTVNVFAGLTKLHLSLALHGRRFDDKTPTPLMQMLRQAMHLQSLTITEITGAKPTSKLVKLLGDCKYPEMTSLILDNFRSSEEELLSFILPSKNLKHLHLVAYKLSPGSWENVTRTLKNEMPYLNYVQMN
ncbi:MAG: hypothetical protein Q9209_007883 [Squamulea sp. 1 TL-2023]